MKTLIFLVLFLYIFMKCYTQDLDFNEFAVEMDMDALEANLDLSKYNIEVIRKVKALGNVYHVKHIHNCNQTRCKREASDSIINILKRHPMIHRVEEQIDLEVEQKFKFPELEYFYDDHELDIETQRKVLEEVDNDLKNDLDADTDMEKKPSFKNKIYTSRIKSKESIKKKETPKRKKYGDNYQLSKDTEEYLQLVKERQKRLNGFTFNDPQINKLWQYHNFGQLEDVNPGFDMNLFNVYKANITGRGIVVSVIDDGVDTQHEEIKKNFDPAASLDLNDPRNVVSDPRGPRYLTTVAPKDGHGTLCASIIAGESNNNICGFGIAFNSNLGGIRMLAQNMVTDLLEAYALTHNNQYIDIYSNSWGPKDSGKKTAPVTYYVQKAMEIGTKEGRGGKGSIYLFAAGNGGVNDDHCGGDGFVNSPYTVAVTSINIHGRKPTYTEECAAISITAAVGGISADSQFEGSHFDPCLVTAEINNKCNNRFVGTSAATPLVAGCIALAFEANIHLNWRDIQHLFTISGRIPNPDDQVWQLNTAGFLVSHLYGFGLLDCTAFVRNAQMWRSVGPLRICVAGKARSNEILKIRSGKKTRITFQTTACANTDKAVYALEHVLVHTQIRHQCRGDLVISLTSPTNTKSFLLKQRVNDRNDENITFSFLSLMNWGENPYGKWHFEIVDLGECGSSKKSDETGHLSEVVLEFYGTSQRDSAYYKNKNLLDRHFNNVGIRKPEQSIILNANQTYNYFQKQRTHFINLNTVHEKVIHYKERIKKNKSPQYYESINNEINQLNYIPEDEVKYLKSLLHDTKHNTL